MCLGAVSGVEVGVGANAYRYNGKELLDEHGYYFYGFRIYDPAIGRFPSADPIADQFPWVSVYNYAENEPVGHVDLHGLQQGDPWYKNVFSFFGITWGPSNTRNAPRTPRQAQQQSDRREAVENLIDVDGALTRIEDVLVDVENRSGQVENASLAVTFASGGATSEITVPVAVTADGVGKGALIGQALIQLIRDGEVSSDTKGDLAVEFTFFVGEKQIGRTLDQVYDLADMGKNAEEHYSSLIDWVVNQYKEATKQVVNESQNEDDE